MTTVVFPSPPDQSVLSSPPEKKIMQLSKEKRQRNNSEALSPVATTPKRQKLKGEKVEGSSPNLRMDSKELASAFALASLASFSPRTKCTRAASETEDEEEEDQFEEENSIVTATATLDTADETRSPKEDPVPITPESRSHFRHSKRVHFAPGVKAKQSPHSPRPTRRFGGFSPYSSRPPPPPSFSYGVPHTHSPSGYGRAAFPFRHQPPLPWMHGRMLPPPRLIQPPLVPPSDQHWICDYCNTAAFTTYEEACVHEEACRVQCMSSNPELATSRGHTMMYPRGNYPPGVTAGSVNTHHHHHHHPLMQSVSECSTDEHDPGCMTVGGSASSRQAISMEWFSGSISLSIPESDSEWLSEINCYIRKFCIEAFSATEEDVTQTSKRGRITLDQVGIRCRYCKHRPLKDRAVAAVSYPTLVAGIYESVKRWQRVHLEHCEDVPKDVSHKMSELQNTNVWIPTTRQYWTDSARSLGMVDTEAGIRFSCDPKYLRESNKTEPSTQLPCIANGSVAECDEAVLSSSPPSSTDVHLHQQELGGGPSGSENGKSNNNLSDGEYIVFPDDMHIVPPYVYFLMRQVESCHFSEVDRFVARSKGPVGYPGFQCRHCSGHAGLGKYFPVSAKTLSTNSTSQNIHAHLLKCRKCPEHIKEKLVALKVEKSRSPRLEPGWRKIFFDKVWARLHG